MISGNFPQLFKIIFKHDLEDMVYSTEKRNFHETLLVGFILVTNFKYNKSYSGRKRSLILNLLENPNIKRTQANINLQDLNVIYLHKNILTFIHLEYRFEYAHSTHLFRYFISKVN